MITQYELVELIASELKRQYNGKEDSIGWYTEARDTTNKLEYIAIDGNPNLYKLAKVIMDNINNKEIRNGN